MIIMVLRMHRKYRYKGVCLSYCDIDIVIHCDDYYYCLANDDLLDLSSFLRLHPRRVKSSAVLNNVLVCGLCVNFHLCRLLGLLCNNRT